MGFVLHQLANVLRAPALCHFKSGSASVVLVERSVVNQSRPGCCLVKANRHNREREARK